MLRDMSVSMCQVPRLGTGVGHPETSARSVWRLGRAVLAVAHSGLLHMNMTPTAAKTLVR